MNCLINVYYLLTAPQVLGLFQFMPGSGLLCHCLDGAQSCDLHLFLPVRVFLHPHNGITAPSARYPKSYPALFLLPPPTSNLIRPVSPVGPSSEMSSQSLPNLLSLSSGWTLTTSLLLLPQVSTSLMWTPPKLPPIFLEPTSDDLIPNQSLPRAQSIAFTIWPQLVLLPQLSCSPSTLAFCLQTSHCLQAFALGFLEVCLMPFLLCPWKPYMHFKSYLKFTCFHTPVLSLPDPAVSPYLSHGNYHMDSEG